MIEASGTQSVGASNTRLVNSESLTSCRDGPHPRTQGAIGIDGVADDSAPRSAAAGVNPAVSSGCDPITAGRSANAEAAAFGASSMIEAHRN